MIWFEQFLTYVNVFFVAYLIGYATYLFLSIIIGGIRLYQRNRMGQVRNELKHDYYLPISIIIPAYNEEVTIVDTIISLLNLDYRLYEIIVVDDGSQDQTLQNVLRHFEMDYVDRPIHRRISCQSDELIFESNTQKVKITMIRKKNGGKGDALNLGINASEYPYFLCIDADSMLQRDSLEKIIQPVMENDNVVAVGGLVRIAQCVSIKDGLVESYHLPNNPITCMQVLEYDRSFLASRILLDFFNGNLIISGAFGLFKKDIVVACGGYDTITLGEDMELATKLHVFCRNNNIDYAIRYESNAICWSQAPSSLKDLIKQRRRWHLGLFQCLTKYHRIFLNFRFGFVSFISYMYYMLYELLSPMIEIFGLITIGIAVITGFINVQFMLTFYLLYAIYGAILTLTAFFQRVYTQHISYSFLDVLKAVLVCFLESVYFRFVLSFIRATSFIGYKKKKRVWGNIERHKFEEN